MDCSDGCPTAAVMFGVPGVRVLTAERDGGGLRLTVETDRQVGGATAAACWRAARPARASAASRSDIAACASAA
jgi:hypothetical protein